MSGMLIVIKTRLPTEQACD